MVATAFMRRCRQTSVTALGVKQQRLTERNAGRPDLHPRSQWHLGAGTDGFEAAANERPTTTVPATRVLRTCVHFASTSVTLAGVASSQTSIAILAICRTFSAFLTPAVNAGNAPNFHS